MTITCYDVHGNTVAVAAESVVYRPAVYGLLLENARLLLAVHPQTGLWHPPGLILQTQMQPEQAIQYYMQQLLQFVPQVDSLLWLEERHLVDGQQRAWRLSAVYYGLKRPFDSKANTLETETLQWVPLTRIEPTKMQFGYAAFLAARRHWQL